jgi:hypothetical protein
MLWQVDSNVFARRVHASSPADAVGTSGILELPQSFGSIFLGEQFACYISVGNYSAQAVKDVVIKAELQSSRAKVILHSTGPAPLPQLQPGEPGCRSVAAGHFTCAAAALTAELLQGSGTTS